MRDESREEEESEGGERKGERGEGERRRDGEPVLFLPSGLLVPQCRSVLWSGGQ